MSYYEIWSTIISILPLGATIFFGIAVLKLSKNANEIAEESVRVQKEAFEKQINKDSNDIIQQEYSDKNSRTIDNLNKIDKNLNKKLNTYNAGMNKLKADEYKNWKRKNELAKKQFLNHKK